MTAASQPSVPPNPTSSAVAVTHPVTLQDPSVVAAQLLGYLRRRFHLNDLTFLAAPQAILHGWETYTFWFELQPCASLPRELHGPLVLRVYASPVGLPNADREYRAEKYLKPVGFPVAHCLFLEPDAGVFGGPFLVSEKVEGELFPDFLYCHPWRILELPRSMGCLHAELHQIPIDQTLSPSEPFLDRQLRELNRLIQEYDLTELRPGIRWLHERRPEQATPSAILHLDFHPLNLLYDESRGFTVLDWSQVDIGDRHADVAVSKMFMDCMQIERPTLWEQFNFWGGRLLLRQGYETAYEEHLELNHETLSYYSAWAAFRRLCTYGAWFKAGPAALGTKPASLGNITDEHIESFCRYFEQHSGVPTALGRHKAPQLQSGTSKSIMASHAILG